MTLAEMKDAVVKELKHFWLGGKLLYAESRASKQLLQQVLNGHELSRRERRQLTRTTADLLRIVPFVVVMSIPFMEFALPLIIKIFPKFLVPSPSTLALILTALRIPSLPLPFSLLSASLLFLNPSHHAVLLSPLHSRRRAIGRNR
jgi:hypothetical protein